MIDNSEVIMKDTYVLEYKKVRPGKKFKAGKDKNIFSSLSRSCALNSRWVLWSNTVFFLGNICYILLDIMDIKSVDVEENETNTSWFTNEDLKTFLNFFGAFLFLANPISDFMGNWAEDKVIEIHERISDNDSQTISEPHSKEDELEEEIIEENQINYDKIVAIIFFFGSLIYVYLAFLDFYNPESNFYEPIDIFASHLFVIDSGIGLIGWNVNRMLTLNSARARYLLTFDPYLVDWSGYGDLSFFIGSIIDAIISYTEGYPLKTQYYLSLYSDSLWLINSVLYTIGYCYGQDVRRRFANKYYTSLELLSSDENTNLPYTVELKDFSVQIP